MKGYLLLAGLLLTGTGAVAQTGGNVGIGTTDPKAQLHTTGTVRLDILKGSGSRLIYADDSGRLFTAPPPTNTTATAIPDNACPGASSAITITGRPQAIPAGRVKVRVNITHPSDQDLVVYLIAPNGIMLPLAVYNGANGANFTHTIFSDDAPQSITAGAAPFSGAYRPSGAGFNCSPSPSYVTFAGSFAGLGVFSNGTIVPDGTWTLWVRDGFSGGTGTLNSWSITFDGSDPVVPQAPFTANVIPKGGGAGLVNGSIYDNGSSIGIGTVNPAPAAALELSSATQGFLPPRMTTAQRNAIPAPVEGLTIYNTETRCANTYQGGAWYDPCAQLTALSGGQKINALLGGDNAEYIYDLQQTTDGGYVLAGQSSSSGTGNITGGNHGYDDYWVAKLDATGAVSWNRLLGGRLYDYGYSVQQTADGGYILAGASSSSANGDVTDTSHGGWDAWVVKLDPAGNTVWNKLVGGSGEDRVYCIRQTTDGGYIMSGYSMSSASGNIAGPNHGYIDAWITKLDAAGGVTWSKLLGGDTTDYARSVVQTEDGGYIVAGYTISSASGNVSGANHGGSDYWIIKLDAAGNTVWNKVLGGSADDYGRAVQQTADGGYIVGGYTASSASGNVSGTNHGGNDYWIVRLDAAGNMVWNKVLGGTGDDIAWGLRLTSDGGCIIAGNSNTPTASGDVTRNSYGYIDGWVVKLDAAGNTAWNKLLGGASADYLTCVQQTADGGYMVGGNSNSVNSGTVTGTPHGGYILDAWVVKLNALGAVVR